LKSFHYYYYDYYDYDYYYYYYYYYYFIIIVMRMMMMMMVRTSFIMIMILIARRDSMKRDDMFIYIKHKNAFDVAYQRMNSKYCDRRYHPSIII
jgi:hypothetical protein